MANRVAEDTLRGKPKFSLNYILVPAKVNEKRPGIDRNHQDLRPDSLVLQPHQQIPPQPPLRARRADRTQSLRPAGDADPCEVHQAASAAFGRRQPHPGDPPVPNAPGERLAMPEGRELRLRRQVHRRNWEAGRRLAAQPPRGDGPMKRYGHPWEGMISFEDLLRAAHAAGL